MNIKSDAPQMEALRKSIEELIGGSTSHTFFIKLQETIEERLKERISVSTLERVWGYSTRKGASISVMILNIISQLTGAKDWNDFCAKTKEEKKGESEVFVSSEAIVCSNLAPGTRVKIGWLPDRLCEIEHTGNGRFVVVNALNSSIKTGDEFSCSIIEKGKQLYIDNIMRNGNPLNNDGVTRYVVGKNNGITIAEIL